MTKSERTLRNTRVASYYARPASYTDGGVNRSRLEWCDRISSICQDILLIVPRRGYQPTSTDLPQVAIRHIGRSRSTMIPLGLWRVLHTIDLLILHEGWTLSNLIAGWFCRLRGVPYVVIPHGVYEPEIMHTLKSFPGRLWLEGVHLRKSLAVHLFFASEVEDIERWAGPIPRIIAPTGVPMTVSPRHQDASRQLLTSVGWFGRYDVWHKGLDIMVQALGEMPEGARPHLSLHGPDYKGGIATLVGLCDSLGIVGQVSLGAALNEVGKAELLQSIDAFVLPSRWEVFGRSAVEAMAVGVPVILSSRTRLAREMPSDSFILFDGSAHGLAVCLAQWDAHSARSIGLAGSEWAKQFLDWDASITSYGLQLAELL